MLPEGLDEIFGSEQQGGGQHESTAAEPSPVSASSVEETPFLDTHSVVTEPGPTDVSPVVPSRYDEMSVDRFDEEPLISSAIDEQQVTAAPAEDTSISGRNVTSGAKGRPVDHGFAQPRPGRSKSTANTSRDRAQLGVDAPSRPQQSSSGSWLGFLFVLALGVFAGGAYYYFQGPGSLQIYPRGELKSMWESRLASDRTKVVRQAITPNVENSSFALNLIVRSTMESKASKDMPNFFGDVIRIAYHPAWEVELTPRDRRGAVIYACLPFAGRLIPKELIPEIASLHPGVKLALAVAFPANTKILSNLSLKSLIDLPPPIGKAAAAIAVVRPNATLADPVVNNFADLAVRGFSDPVRLIDFVVLDPEGALAAIAVLYAGNDEKTVNVLDILLNHPNAKVQDPLLDWARESDLINWEGVGAHRKLQILAGNPPDKQLSSGHLARLFKHPVPRMRSYAVSEIINVARFAHPAAFEVLRIVGEKPSILDGMQTFHLALLLENPSGYSNKYAALWLGSKPPTELLAKIVVLGSQQAEASNFDYEVSRYLQQAGWEPDVSDLALLVRHPDKLTRFYALTKVYELVEATEAVKIFERQLTQEPDKEFRLRISDMLSQLKGSS
jgi:hypothetical protein